MLTEINCEQTNIKIQLSNNKLNNLSNLVTGYLKLFFQTLKYE